MKRNLILMGLGWRISSQRARASQPAASLRAQLGAACAQVREFIRERCDDANLVGRLHVRVDALEHPVYDSTCVFALVGSWQRATVAFPVLLLGDRTARRLCRGVRDLGFAPVVEFITGPSMC